MTPAEQMLTLLEHTQQEMTVSLDELSRRAGNVLRHGLMATDTVMGGYGRYPLSYVIKQVTRSYHNLQGDVDRYKAKKRAIRQSDKPRQQKRRELDALEKTTLASLGAKVRAARNKKRMARGKEGHGVTRRDIRTAKRSLYGTTFGTRVV